MPVRVLVVDDDPMVCELLAVTLEAEGYSVASADSGASALAYLLASATSPHVVLADVQMPGLAGAELARKLRRACGPGAQLLAMSGSGPASEAIALFDGFLLKPFSVGQFAAAISSRTSPTRATKRRTIARGRVTPPVTHSQPRSAGFSISASASEEASNLHMESPQPNARPAHSSTNGRDPTTPVLNEKIYQQLAASMPAPQLREMYAMCLSDARQRIAAMRALARTGDRTRFSGEAHSIKGGSGMLGATEIYTLAAKLEAETRDSPQSEPFSAVNSLDELSTACDRLERILGSRA